MKINIVGIFSIAGYMHMSVSSKTFFALYYSQLLQKNMQLLMDSVETLQQDNYRLIGYEKTVAKQTQAKMAFMAKRVSAHKCVYYYCDPIVI